MLKMCLDLDYSTGNQTADVRLNLATALAQWIVFSSATQEIAGSFPSVHSFVCMNMTCL
jgi:hypothetical protein